MREFGDIEQDQTDPVLSEDLDSTELFEQLNRLLGEAQPRRQSAPPVSGPSAPSVSEAPQEAPLVGAPEFLSPPPEDPAPTASPHEGERDSAEDADEVSRLLSEAQSELQPASFRHRTVERAPSEPVSAIARPDGDEQTTIDVSDIADGEETRPRRRSIPPVSEAPRQAQSDGASEFLSPDQEDPAPAPALRKEERGSAEVIDEISRLLEDAQPQPQLASLEPEAAKPAPSAPVSVSPLAHQEEQVPVDASDAAEPGSADINSVRATLLAEKLFDLEWYAPQHPDIIQADLDPSEHYFAYGAFEGRRPNPYFDPRYYLETYPEAKSSELEPLTHYVRSGERAGYRPSPLFDPVWYRDRYDLDEAEIALAHYLARRTTGKVSPIPEFDAEFYTKAYPDIGAAGIDSFEHYINHGFREGRNPSKDFDTNFYIKRYLRGSTAECPLFHFLAHRHEAGVYGRMPDDEASIPREIKRFTRPGPDFEEFKPVSVTEANRKAKLLAYYLPQFHAFPENNAWWGEGFTEWTNIVRGVPRFAGHYQPRVPRDLGFYTLDTNDTLRRQVAMAQAAGLFGFVFYHYWFNGRRLMEAPIERFLADASIDMPFCLMWANENWTRRWDGAENEVLISQDYLEDDDERLLADFSRHFQDPRYIRVEGRPLLMIYRPRLIPETAQTMARWRKMFREQFQEDPILVMAQSFNDTDPRVFGMDGAIEFPPHKLTATLPPITNTVTLLDNEFEGQVYRYEDVIQVSLEEPALSYPLIKTLVPSWDNDARRQGSGLTLIDSTPAKYENWLTQLIARAQKAPFFGEAFVCVNAWNEWCEGAYLEPDLHFGAAYLNATSRAVTGVSQRTNSRLVLIGHDAFPSGAQQLLLNIGRQLRAQHGVEIEFLLLGGGKLERDYTDLAPTTLAANPADALRRLKALRERGFSTALVNTTAAAHIVAGAADLGFETHLLVHELPRIIREKDLTAGATAGISAANSVVFPAPYVRDKVTEVLGLPVDERMQIVPNGLYKDVSFSPEGARQIRADLGLGPEDRLVLGMGYADMRKGFDHFLALWRSLRDGLGDEMDRGRVHCCWVGGIDPQLKDWLEVELAGAQATGTFHLAGYQTAVTAYLSAADAFVLTSREDPFPAVVLEALSAGSPLVAFDRSGGIPDMLRETGFGAVVPHGDVGAMAAAVGDLVQQSRGPEERQQQQELARTAFAWAPYVQRLLGLTLPGVKTVSVAVPNYNYARFMPDRLGSIFRQSYPVHEVIVLDDQSTDDSLPVIRRTADEWRRQIELVPNAQNSGSVFAQWRKAAELASGDFLWIAEADDLCDPDFLARVIKLMDEDPNVVLGFSDSRAIDSDGTDLLESYKGYYATVEPGALSRSGVFNADEFVRRYLSVKNLIMNVSAVVWRRDALLRALDRCRYELDQFKVAGDWRLYLDILAEPGAQIAYEATPLNTHRRHTESVTHSLRADLHIAEIERLQARATWVFRLPEATQRAQQAYLEEVTEYLKKPRRS